MAFFYACQVGALGTAILIVNNLRDIVTDKKSRKITTAVLMGPKATRAFYVLMVTFAYLVPVIGVVALGSPLTVLLAWLSLPLGIKAVRALYASEGVALNPVLGQTAKLQLVSGLLLALGIALGGLLG